MNRIALVAALVLAACEAAPSSPGEQPGGSGGTPAAGGSGGVAAGGSGGTVAPGGSGGSQEGGSGGAAGGSGGSEGGSGGAQGGDGGAPGGAGGGGAGGEGGAGGVGGMAGMGGEPGCVSPDVKSLAPATVWQISGEMSDRILGLATDGTSRWIVSGMISDGADLGSGALMASGLGDGFVASISGGETDWVRTASTEDYDESIAVAADASGNVFVSSGLGLYSPNYTQNLEALDAAGKHRWDLPISPLVLAADADGDLITATMCDRHPGKSVPRFCIVKRAGDTGELLWETRFSADYIDSDPLLAVAPDGTVYVSGRIGAQDELVDFGDGDGVEGNTSFTFVLALDADDGSFAWKHVLLPPKGESGFPLIQGLAVTPEGDVVAAGTYYDVMQFADGTILRSKNTFGGFVARLAAADGARVWSTQTPRTDLRSPVAIGQDRAVVAINFVGELQLGGKPFGSATGYNVAVLSLDLADGSDLQAALAGSAPSLWLSAMTVTCDGAVRLGAYFSGDLDLSDRTVTAESYDDALLLELAPPR